MAQLRDYLSLVKFSHSVFALPFAVMALLVAAHGRPGARTLLLVLVAMVCARTAAMAYNRFADRFFDAANPRTQAREIPRGLIRPWQALAVTIGAAAGFVLAAGALSPLCFWLAWPALGVLLGYSHAKRFTAWSHGWLGLALGLAPPAAWLAVRGAVDATLTPALALGAGVTLWVAGFDMLYACQDTAFDRAQGLHSVPAKLGVPATLRLSRVLHAVAVVLFALFGVQGDLGALYQVGVVAAAAFLVYEHRLLRGGNLARIDAAFFTMNGLVGLVLLVATAAAVYT